ncbi:MAG: hypothetical protein ACYS4T_02580 [Planctomycetota bacterium]
MADRREGSEGKARNSPSSAGARFNPPLAGEIRNNFKILYPDLIRNFGVSERQMLPTA